MATFDENLSAFAIAELERYNRTEHRSGWRCPSCGELIRQTVEYHAHACQQLREDVAASAGFTAIMEHNARVELERIRTAPYFACVCGWKGRKHFTGCPNCGETRPALFHEDKYRPGV